MMKVNEMMLVAHNSESKRRFRAAWLRVVGCLVLLASIDIGPGGSYAMTDNAGQGPSSATGTTDGRGKIGQASKAKIFHDVLDKFAAGQHPDPVLMKQFVDAQNDGMTSGPNVGEKVPDFSLPDYQGREHSLHSLMGSNGLLLVFVRSADW